MVSHDNGRDVLLLVGPKVREDKLNGDGSPKLIGLSNACTGGE